MAVAVTLTWLLLLTQLPALQEKIQQQQHDISTQEAELKQHQLQQWQQAMKHDIPARRKWVHKTTHNTNNCQVTQNMEILLHDQAVLQRVHQRWTNLWQAASLPDNPAQATQVVLTHLPQHEPLKPLQDRPTLEDFKAAKTNLKGAQGPDGWLHNEPSMLPDDFTSWFRQVTPTSLRYSRQCNLPKPGKIKRGQIDIEHLRPINIYSVWYRWWSSSWSRSQLVRAWVKHMIPDTMSAAVSCEQQASALSRCPRKRCVPGFT